ncbi:HEXXH motif-containing putative peptide modification protein [Rhizobium sp. 2YAF20]|uniref:aKG-HExxH-type peptide beta-hydroxylase n=1 Tax=Rhizobium sp. 2YAF20 TaxID=3233027 RepID=UPI003F947338
MRSKNLISAFPSTKNAELARRNFYFKMFGSLAYMLSLVKGTRTIDLSAMLTKLGSVEILNPRIFYLHDKLLLALRAQNKTSVDRIVDCIAEEVASTERRAEAGPDVASLGVSDWETFIAENSKELGEEYFRQRPIIEPVSEEIAHAEQSNIRSAIALISDYFPEMRQELDVFLNKVRIFQGTVTMGITDVRMFGCMLIRTPRPGVNPKLYYGEHLTHEISHMYLNAAMAIDPIVLNDRSELFTSPIRPDPRPMLGVFHATFVTARIVQLFDRLATHDGDREVLVYLYQQIDELSAGIQEIAKGARLTDAGHDLLGDFEEIIDTCTYRDYWSSFDKSQAYTHRFGGEKVFEPSSYHPLFADLRAEEVKHAG